jgi:hypothetical protein
MRFRSGTHIWDYAKNVYAHFTILEVPLILDKSTLKIGKTLKYQPEKRKNSRTKSKFSK